MINERGQLRFVVSHPSRKNKGAARMGHPIPIKKLKVEGDFGGQRAGGDVVCAAEGGEEVVEGVVVGEVDGGEVEIDFVAFGVEDVVFAEGGVKEAARCNALRVSVAVAGAGSGDGEQ